MDSCYKHLASVQKQEDGSYKRYYQPVDDLKLLDDVKENVSDLLDDALKNKVISEDEKSAMEPGDTGVGKFYCLYKVHKEHTAPNTSSVAVVALPKILESMLTTTSNL